MKVLVVYDSGFGNTRKVVEVISKTLGGRLKAVRELNNGDWQEVELLVVGSPVHGGRPTAAVQKWLDSLPKGGLKGKKAAVFDTRLEESEQKWALKLLMKTIGYAAEKMAKMLKNKGAEVTAEAEGFIVMGKEGPMKKGELVRAREWAERLT